MVSVGSGDWREDWFAAPLALFMLETILIASAMISALTMFAKIKNAEFLALGSYLFAMFYYTYHVPDSASINMYLGLILMGLVGLHKERYGVFPCEKLIKNLLKKAVWTGKQKRKQ